MAVSSSSSSVSAPIPSTNNEKKRKKEMGKTSRSKSQTQSHDIQQQTPPPPPPPPCSSPPKRTKSPGVRVVEGRIFESENVKYCHQCRQKIKGCVASCKNQRNNNPCSIKVCHKCLLNRYGEKAEDMSILDDWQCPKCRGICNCSSCMKKRGQQPTGILVHTSKATGFSSVSEMLHVKGPGNLGPGKIIKNESAVTSTKTCGKENRFDGESDSSLQHKPLAGIGDRKKAGKRKWEELSQSNSNYNACQGEDGSLPEKKSPNKSRVSKEIFEKEQGKKEGLDDIGPLEKLNSPTRFPGEISSDHIEKEEGKDERNGLLLACNDTEGSDSGNADNMGPKTKPLPESQKLEKNAIKTQNKDSDADFPLPQGDAITTIAGINLSVEDVGHALQFLEFCAAFGEVLDMKKGQPESVLRELMRGRSSRRGHDSLTAQIHIQLLSLIPKDSRKKYNYWPKYPLLRRTSSGNSWLQALGKCISKSWWALKELPSDCLDKFGDGYNKLDSSKKLRLLNFLCDEALGSVDLRSWIDEQTSKFVEREKEAKQKVLATEENEKHMKHKLQDEVAKAILLKDGNHLSISEYEGIVSKIKTEAALAHTQMLEAQDMVSKKKQKVDAVRTEPILLDRNGRAFWRLKSYPGESNVLLQEIGCRESVTPEEKWFTFDVEQTRVVDKYISSFKDWDLKEYLKHIKAC